MKIYYGLDNLDVDIIDKQDISTIKINYYKFKKLKDYNLLNSNNHICDTLFGDPHPNKEKQIKICFNQKSIFFEQFIKPHSNNKPMHNFTIEYGLDNNKINITDKCYEYLYRDGYILLNCNNIFNDTFFGDPIIGEEKKIYIKYGDENFKYESGYILIDTINNTIYDDLKIYYTIKSNDKIVNDKNKLKDVTDICFSKLKYGDYIKVYSNNIFCDSYFKDHLPNIEKYIYIEIDGQIKEYRSDISINVIDNSVSEIDKTDINIYISCSNNYKFMYDPFIKTTIDICLKIYNIIPSVNGNLNMIQPGDMFIFIGCDKMPDFNKFKKKGVKTILYWTEPFTLHTQAEEIWLYGEKLYNDQLIFTKDKIIKFVPILYEPKLPLMDYSKDSKLELIFLGDLRWRVKQRKYVESIENFKCIYDIWDNKSYNHFIMNHRCIFLNLNKGDSKYIPSARISKILSHGGIIISEHCSSIDETLYEGLVYFTSVDKIKDLFLSFVNKTPLELKEISNDIFNKFCKKFTVETMIS